MDKPATHAVVTFCAHDMNGFAPLGEITVERYEAAPEGPKEIDRDNAIILDLWSAEAEGVIANKSIDVATAAQLLDWPADQLVSRGRQAVAAHEDDLRDVWQSTRRKIKAVRSST